MTGLVSSSRRGIAARRAVAWRALSSRHAAPWLAWAAAGVAGVAAWAVLRASGPAPGGDPMCVLRRVAHTACPTCGMTRALALLAAGEWRAALTLHPWAPAVAAQIVAAWTLWGAALACGDAGPNRGTSPDRATVLDRLACGAAALERRVPQLVAFNVAALLVLWLVRLATGTLPPI